MSQHVGALCVTVVGNEEACVHGVGIGVKSLQNLYTFRPWGSAHVKHRVARLYVEHSHRNHGHFLLTEQMARLRARNDELVKVLQLGMLAQLYPRQFVECEDYTGGRIPEHLLGGLISQSLVSLHHSNEGIEFVFRLHLVLVRRVYSEADVQGLLQFVIKSRPFAWWHDVQLSVVPLELRIAFLTRIVDPPVSLLGWSLLFGLLQLNGTPLRGLNWRRLRKRLSQLIKSVGDEAGNVLAYRGSKSHLPLEQLEQLL